MSGLNQKKDSIAIYEDDGQLAQKLFGNDNINIEINNNNNNSNNNNKKNNNNEEKNNYNLTASSFNIFTSNLVTNPTTDNDNKNIQNNIHSNENEGKKKKKPIQI